MRRLATLSCLVLAVALVGCDSSSGNAQPQVVDGDFRVARFTFDSENSTYGVIDMRPYLYTSGVGAAPELGLNLFAQSRAFVFYHRLRTDAVRASAQGTYRVRGSEVTVDLGGQAAAARVLLPSSLTLAVRHADTLSADTRQTVDLSTLAALDPERYRGLTGTLTGRLRLTLARAR